MEEILILARAFSYSHEAHLFAAQLENAGIRTFIHDDNMASVNPLMTEATGGVKVLILNKDLEKAKLVLEEQDLEERESRKRDSLDLHGKKLVPFERICNSCDSKNVFVEDYSVLKTIIAFIISWSFFVPAPYKKRFFCGHCKHVWKD